MRPLLLAVPAAILGALLTASAPSVVEACSGGPDWDPVAQSEQIVEGRISGWQAADPAPGSPAAFPFTTIELDLRVDQIWKGASAASVRFIDTASLEASSGSWHGSSGACGAFDADPAGAYAILGLMRFGDGSLRSNLLTTFYIGEGPGDPRYDEAVLRLSALGVRSLPVTGSGPPSEDAGQSGHRLLWVPILALPLLISGGGLARKALKRHERTG